MSIRAFFYSLIGLFITACASVPYPPVQMRIEASKQLNVDTSHVALPVRLKIYQLSDITAFNEATFRQLWKTDVSTLGSTLLAKKELTIEPGDEQMVKMPRHEQADYLAVVGIFRRHEDEGWKAYKPLPGQVNAFIKKMTITANQNRLEIH